MSHSTFIRDLGDGLVLRRAALEDTDALVKFNSIIHSGSSEPNKYVAGHTYDLISGRLPGFTASDFTIVEDTRTGQIVSSLSLIPQVWAYEGISFKAGRPEIVGTAPEYRRRGLVRAQFEEVHRWSKERGQVVQVITGNPWYYRQFGYEMALNLDGCRMGYGPNIPRLAEGESEPYAIRPAGEGDLEFIARVYACNKLARQPVVCLRDEALWRYELSGRGEFNLNRQKFYIIEGAAQEPQRAQWQEPQRAQWAQRQEPQTLEPQRVGFFTLSPWLSRATIWLGAYELEPGYSWAAVTPSVLRCMWAVGEEYAGAEGKTCEKFGLSLGEEHPVYDVFPECLPVTHQPYAWYMRVADLPAFVRLIAPALEKRLAGSPAAGYSGRMKISFYRGGIELVFEDGRLAQEANWPPTQEDWGDAAFPDLTFLQLLFGYRSVDDLKYAFADCWVNDRRQEALLKALFPKKASDVWGVG